MVGEHAPPNILWELDGYSTYTNGSPILGTGGVPKVWTQADYSNAAIQRLHAGAGLLRQDLLHLAARPARHDRHHRTPPPLEQLPQLIGINSYGSNQFSTIWSTWQGQGRDRAPAWRICKTG